jgi:hypothetical protein
MVIPESSFPNSGLDKLLELEGVFSFGFKGFWFLATQENRLLFLRRFTFN